MNDKLLWLFDYDTVCALSPLAGALWAFGGGGVKSLRRFILMAIFALSACSMGVSAWLWLPSFALLSGASTLSYGDEAEENLSKIGFKGLYWALVYAVGASYGVSLIPLLWAKQGWFSCVSAPVLTATVFAGGMFISKNYGLPWKLIEIATGMIIGGLVAFAIYP